MTTDPITTDGTGSDLRDAYFAGLIDGEGCLRLKPKPGNGTAPLIAVNMACEKTIRTLHTHFQRGTVIIKSTAIGHKVQCMGTRDMSRPGYCRFSLQKGMRLRRS
jgi:hypothetical protein